MVVCIRKIDRTYIYYILRLLMYTNMYIIYTIYRVRIIVSEGVVMGRAFEFGILLLKQAQKEKENCTDYVCQKPTESKR